MLKKKKKRPGKKADTSPVKALLDKGLGYHKAGKLSRAGQLYRQVLKTDPAQADALFFLGVLARDAGNPDLAVQLISQAVSSRPKFAMAYSRLADILLGQHRVDEAVENFQKAVFFQPDLAENHYNLGCALMRKGRLDDAMKGFLKALDINPNFARAHNNLGMINKQRHDYEKALFHHEAAVSLDPEFAKAHNNLGVLFKDFNQSKKAEACFEKAVALSPGFAQAYKNWAQTVTHARYSDRIKAMEDLFHSPDTGPGDKMVLGFGLGKAFEDLKVYEKAFEYIGEANRLNRSFFSWDLAQERARFEQMTQVFAPPFFDCHKKGGCRDETPIFIIGMPRSGTSLVEQILSSHPQVYGAGELSFISELAGSFAWRTHEKGVFVPKDGQEHLASVGQVYLSKVRKFSKASRFITDKMPHNFVNAGFIRTILPNARIIHCRRDPMDTCFSIFKTYFSDAKHPYGYDLVELGNYYLLYRKLMAHWQKVLPTGFFSIDYETLVLDQENQTRALLAYCDLPWDDACLGFHKTKRFVTTASSGQVRRPMYTDSVKLWTRYEQQLAPLKRVLNSLA